MPKNSYPSLRPETLPTYAVGDPHRSVIGLARTGVRDLEGRGRVFTRASAANEFRVVNAYL
jgi:hypothetical protein